MKCLNLQKKLLLDDVQSLLFMFAFSTSFWFIFWLIGTLTENSVDHLFLRWFSFSFFSGYISWKSTELQFSKFNNQKRDIFSFEAFVRNQNNELTVKKFAINPMSTFKIIIEIERFKSSGIFIHFFCCGMKSKNKKVLRGAKRTITNFP